MPSSSRRKPKVWAPESKNQENHSSFSHGLWYCCCLLVELAVSPLICITQPGSAQCHRLQHKSQWEQTEWNMQNKVTSVRLSCVRGKISSRTMENTVIFKDKDSNLLFARQKIICKCKGAFPSLWFFSLGPWMQILLPYPCCCIPTMTYLFQS